MGIIKKIPNKGVSGMKRFIIGLITGFLLATTIGAVASSNIRLVINGKEIIPDVPPQIIDSRVMVPARFIAEPLGATVEWDGENNTVIITDKSKIADPIVEKNNLIHVHELYNNYGIITGTTVRDNVQIYTLSKGDKTIEIDEYYIIDNRLYLNKDVINLFLP